MSNANPNTSLLAKFGAFIKRISTPILIDKSRRDMLVNAGTRPIRSTLHIAVFYRIVMDIIHMPGVVLLIPNEMFPITPLPDAPLAFVYPARVAPFTGGNTPGKTGFDKHVGRNSASVFRRMG